MIELISKLDCSVYYGTEIYPLDDLAIAIVKLNSSDAQIIMRSDANLYSNVQRTISPSFYRDYLWKSGPNTPSRAQIMQTYNQLFRTAQMLR